MSLVSYTGGFKAKGGVPVRNGAGDFRVVGDVWFVDSGAALASDNTHVGRSPDRPFATLDYAIGQATANNGDVIFLAPGHAETVANATTFLVDKAGLTIVGMGFGSLRPTFTMSATSSSVEIDSANTYISNIRLVPSIANVVVGVNVDASNVTLDSIAFELGSTTNLGFILMVDATAVDYVTITNCRFLTYIGETTNAPVRAIKADNSDYLRIEGNVFFGDWSTAAIHNSTDTTEGAPTSIGWVIRGNEIYNGVTTDGVATSIRLVNACTGLLAFNTIGVLTDGAESNLDPGSLRCIQNYITAANDQSGRLVPILTDT